MEMVSKEAVLEILRMYFMNEDLTHVWTDEDMRASQRVCRRLEEVIVDVEAMRTY